jgi:hypothetical protein
MCKPWKVAGHNRNRKSTSGLVKARDHRLAVRADEGRE